MSDKISLDDVRNTLAKLEDRIIFSLIGRGEFKVNKVMYVAQGIDIPGFKQSYLDYLLHGTEKLHALAGRYVDKSEHPFFADLPQSLAHRKVDEFPLPEIIDVNRNAEIKTIYLNQISSFCEAGDDNQYGAAAVWDIRCLQDLSRRIHFGMFVAESKYQQDSEGYKALVEDGNVEGIVDKLRNVSVEEKILQRLRDKGQRYGFNPDLISGVYANHVIPRTIDVEVEYLFKRVRG